MKVIQIQETETEPRIKMIHGMTWTRGRMLGSGGFGGVYLAQVADSKTGLIASMAVKSAEVDCALSLFKEKEWMMVQTNFRACPHLLRCYGDDITQENGKKIYNLFLHYCPGGSIADLIKKTGVDVNRVCLPEETVSKYTKSVLLGLKFMHESNFVHRDIKPHNLLLDFDGDVKIADFGLAKKWTYESERRSCKKMKGTLSYMAPETLKEKICGKGVDIWALGCTVVEMITGEPLFKGSQENIIWKICGVKGLPNVDPCAVMSNTAVDFLKKCMFVDPTQRWTAEMLLQHHFITRCCTEEEDRKWENQDGERVQETVN